MAIRKFWLDREIDDTGVSGTGYVAEGVQFSNGKCALTWLTEVASVSIYDRIGDVSAIHSHHGHTKTVFEGEEEAWTI